jgi:branched-chain amino acid transport system ATP-binding protein
MLEVDNLFVNYGPTEAVRGVSLRVPSRGVVALLGSNGAGKSSVLQAVSRLIAFRGAVRFDGTELRGRDAAAVASLGLIHVPEGRRIFSTLTVEENLRMGECARGGRPSRFSLSDVYDLFPPLVRLRDRGGWSLSGGEQQMLAIGRGLLAAPRLLLLDEPSLGLAPTIIHNVYRVLRDIAGTVPMLLVEQSTTEALALADRAYILANGVVVMDSPADELRDQSVLLDSYLR